jgi:hypothetical protein
MALVNKGGPWRYLICQKARAGAGCQYRAVRYQDIEDTLVRNVAAIVHDCPSGNAEEERLLGLIEQADEHIDIMSEELANLLQTAAHRSSPALAERIATTEAAMQATRDKQADLIARHASFAPTRRQLRLEDLERAASTKSLDRGVMNASLRVLVSGIVVDYRTGCLVFRWHHGDETQLFWAWPEEANETNNSRQHRARPRKRADSRI